MVARTAFRKVPIVLPLARLDAHLGAGDPGPPPHPSLLRRRRRAAVHRAAPRASQGFEPVVGCLKISGGNLADFRALGLGEPHLFPVRRSLLRPNTPLERFYATFVHRNLPWRDVLQTTAFVLPLAPGEGLHFPVTVPHWVKNGPEVSVSFSITFRTADSERRELLYKANARLRKLGLSPTPA